jgi:DNA-binding PadR family transcriptional regulator
MSMKHAVLGLLVERRGYGYDLAQRLGERLGPAWQLNSSAVYGALDQLEAEHLVVGARTEPRPTADARSARRAGRVVYEPTEAGERVFNAWLRRPPAKREPIRSEMAMKVALARPEDAAALLEAVEHEEAGARRLLTETVAFETSAAGSWPAAAAALARGSALERLRGELMWLEAVREHLLALQHGAVPQHAPDVSAGRVPKSA